MAEEKKSATIFDLINGVTSKKREWSKWSETDQSKFSVYMVNRYLSMRQDLIDVINELQKYTIGVLRPKETYRLYHDLLPTNNNFAKYVKGKKEDKFSDKLIDQIAEHYKVSKSEAIDYADLLNQDQCAHLLSLYGYTEKEIKTAIKGVRK
jgi:hypothetical protein